MIRGVIGNVRSPTNGFYWNPWLDLQLGDGVVFMSKTFGVPYCLCALVGLCKFLRAMPLGVVECTWNIAPATPVQVFKPKLYHQLLTSVLFKGNSTVASWHRDMRDVTVWWLHQWYWICLFAGPWSCKSNQTTHKYSIGQVPWRLWGQLQRVFFRSEELATSIIIFSNMHFVGGEVKSRAQSPVSRLN